VARPQELLAQSREHVEARDYSTAANLLEEVAFRGTGDEALEAARELALVRRVQGRYGDERTAARRAAELAAGTPSGPAERLRLAEALVRVGSFTEAEAVLEGLGEPSREDSCLYHVVRGLIHARHKGDIGEAVQSFERAARDGSPSDVGSVVARVCLGRTLASSGRVREAEAELRAALRSLDQMAPESLRARLTRAHALLSLAEVLFDIGDLGCAARVCDQAHDEGVELRSAGIIRWYCLRAALLAARLGNLRQAIRLSLAKEQFDAIREIGEPRLRFYPFANATLYAIELGDIEKAQGYLARAEECVQAGVTPYEPAYLLLLHGAIRVARREFDAAERYLDQAEGAFAAMGDGGYRRGLCEVLLQRGELCRARGDVQGVLRIAMRVMEMAGRDGFIDFQSRALLLKSFLLVDESKGLDDVYEDVIQRMHVINSPAVMYKVLSHLYFYCQKFGCYDIESFHWQRLENLRSVLEESVYQDLYREYVAKRYAKKIADVLAGPRLGEPIAAEPEPELPDPRDLDSMF